MFGKFSTGDEGIALPFAPGHGYTGEEAVEFSIHGSLASTRSLIARICKAGARMARPGEFTLRAFMNGRMDLTRAEAVRDTVEAKTEAQLANATLLLSGALNEQVSAIRSAILGVLAEVEARVDFSEELGELNRDAARQALAEALEATSKLVGTIRSGQILREGLRVAIVGLPNAGKSSILNALCGSDRAITSPHPGTTRDYIEAEVDLGGIVCTLVDTAGLRAPESDVEAQGIALTRTLAAGSSLSLYVYDAHAGWSPQDQREIDELPGHVLVIANKCDLVSVSPEMGLPVSTKTEIGLESIGAGVLAAVGYENDGTPLLAPRHGPLLVAAEEALQGSVDVLDHDLPDDLLAVGLRAAAAALGEVVGIEASTDLLDSIFRDFCVGK